MSSLHLRACWRPTTSWPRDEKRESYRDPWHVDSGIKGGESQSAMREQPKEKTFRVGIRTSGTLCWSVSTKASIFGASVFSFVILAP